MANKESPMTIKQKANQAIVDCIQKSIDIILESHTDCVLFGHTGNGNNLEYVRLVTKQLTRNIHTGYFLDILMDIEFQGKIRKILVARWKIRYEEKVNNGKLSYLNKHVGILLRTLYCFVRLLPAYQLSVTRRCQFSFKLYDPDTNVDRIDDFPSKDTMSYIFPHIPTQYGTFTIRTRYVDTNVLKVR